MKKKTSTMDQSRKGKIPDDWAKQGFQLPKKQMKEFRELAGEYGHGGVKILGTAAVSILLALDEDDRQTICQYVFQKTYRSADDLDKRRVLELLKMLLNPDDDAAPVIEPEWYVDKIVDPELSQPPGKKLSDKQKDQGKKSG